MEQISLSAGATGVCHLSDLLTNHRQPRGLLRRLLSLHELFVLCCLSPVRSEWHNKTTKLIQKMFFSLAFYLWLLNTCCHLLVHVPLYAMCFEIYIFHCLHAHTFGQRKNSCRGLWSDPSLWHKISLLCLTFVFGHGSQNSIVHIVTRPSAV